MIEIRGDLVSIDLDGVEKVVATGGYVRLVGSSGSLQVNISLPVDKLEEIAGGLRRAGEVCERQGITA